MTDTAQQPLPETVVAQLRATSTATISTQLYQRGLRNVFLQGPRRVQTPGERMVGEAFTMRCIPAREDLDPLSVYQDYDHPQRVGVESVQPGQVLVIDARGRRDTASLGFILATRLQVRGAAGIVTDGAIRDSDDFPGLTMPVFANGSSPVTNLRVHHVLENQVPIGCGEVPVYPGDVIVGDEDGVVCIPRHLAEEVARDGYAQERLEEFILGKVATGSPLRGTYPASPEVLAEYRDTEGDTTTH